MPARNGPAHTSSSELVIDTRRDTQRMAAAPGRRTRTAVVGELVVRRIVAISLNAMPAGADIVVRVTVVGGVGNAQIRRQLLIKLVPPAEGVHVRLVLPDPVRVVVVLPTRITRC